MSATIQSIDCTEARRRLWEYLDDELTRVSAEEVRRHLQVCAHCFQIADLERIFLEGVAATRVGASVPDPVRARVVVALRQAGLQPR